MVWSGVQCSGWQQWFGVECNVVDGSSGVEWSAV